MFKTLTIGAIAALALTGCAVPVALPTATETVEVEVPVEPEVGPDTDAEGNALPPSGERMEDAKQYRASLSADDQAYYDFMFDSGIEYLLSTPGECEAIYAESAMDTFADDVEFFMTGPEALDEISAIATADALWTYCDFY